MNGALIQPEKIYFDMDGVLADFDRGIRELCGIEPMDQMKATEEKSNEIWDAVRKVDHFYDRLKPKDGALEMFEQLHSKYGETCEILSAIPKPKRGIVTAKDDKIAWVRRLIGPDVKINIVYRAEKKEYCKGRISILIDDYEKNIREWEAYGGTGVLCRSAGQVLDSFHSMGLL